MKMPELLAPVGGKPHLIAAVNNGADAVYMGGMAFNARTFADNFSDEELPDAIRYAHLRGVKVYMTLNTLVKDTELVRVFEYANYIYGLGVDGLIVQDMGLARMLRKYLPDFPLHLSTQATLYNKEGLGTARKLGFTRVVPARELSLDEIRELAAAGAQMDPPMDVEVFIHGALCMCYSGQCQMSRMMGRSSGRSGNRGTCAQPCRQAYTDENGRQYYALSPKDLCLIENIPDIVLSGAASLKIEGRMKTPEYVATVTRIYRKYLDRFGSMCRTLGPEEAKKRYRVDDADMFELRQIFNRGGFTSGYLYGNPGEDILSGSSPKNQGMYLGRVIAVLDSEDKASGKDERAAVRGALRRGKVLVCIAVDRSSALAEYSDMPKNSDIISAGDGLEFRSEDREYLVHAPAGGVATFIKDIGSGCIIAGDFDRGAETGDLVFRVTHQALIDKALDTDEKKLPVTMVFTAREGQFPTLVMTDVRSGYTAEVISDYRVERARKAPTDAERIEGNLARLGDTTFTPGLTGIEVQIDDDIMMPVSIINKMRREAADELMARRAGLTAAGRKPKLSRAELDVSESAEMLGAAGLDIDGFEELAASGDRKLMPVREYMERWKAAGRTAGPDIENALPYILNVSKGGLDAWLRDNFDEAAEAARGTGILIGNFGWIQQFLDAGVRVYGDYGLNIYNEQARKAFEEIGVEVIRPSHETGICDERGIPLMITEHFVEAETLTDRKGELHRVIHTPEGDKTLIF